MGNSLKESRVAAEMAKVLYDFLPGSGNAAWTGHINFASVARNVGVGEFWQMGSKKPAIKTLLENTLTYKRELFEKLIIAIVKAGIGYRQKKVPIKRSEIEQLNGLILEIGFKFPDLWDPKFLATLDEDLLASAKDNVHLEQKRERIRDDQNTENLKKMAEIRNMFYQLGALSDRQAAGFQFEEILNNLFELSGLAPRKSFRITGEQIDGSFELDGEYYLVEAKWENHPQSEAPLLVFRGKIEGKSQFTRGIFIALNGFTQPALQAITTGKQPNFFLMDGYDLASVFEGSIDLVKLLKQKLRRFIEEGKVFLSIREIITTN
jgi:hypothetical protein